MTKTEVIDQLGQPQKQEARVRPNSYFIGQSGRLPIGELRTPIAIRDGVVVGFGDTYSENPADHPELHGMRG
jgi:hypothetical protein